MSLIKDAYVLVRDNTDDWVQRLYMNAVDVNLHSTEETSVLVRNSNSTPLNYGSNQFNTYQGSVQIQIFLALNAPFDFEKKIIELLQIFNRKGWQIVETRPAIADPDTKQLTATVIVSKTKEVAHTWQH